MTTVLCCRSNNVRGHRDDTGLRNSESVHERQGHQQKDDERRDEKPKHPITPMRDIPPAPTRRGNEQTREVRTQHVDVQPRDGTDLRVERDHLRDRGRPRDQEVVDPRHMKRHRTSKDGGKGKGFVNAVAERMG